MALLQRLRSGRAGGRGDRRATPGVGGVRTFTYEAVSAQGTRHKGRMQAPNRQVVTQTLQGDGWVPLSVAEVNNTGLNRDISSMLGVNAQPAVTQAQVANFARQLAQLLAAGVTTSRALQAIGEEQGGRMQGVCVGLAERTSSGIPLWEALGAYDDVFDDVFVAYVRAGEASGSLPQTIARLARAVERKVALSLKIKAVTAYPKIVSFVIGLIVAGVIVFIVPRFSKIYASFNAPLPGPTVALQNMSKYFLPVGASLTLRNGALHTFLTVPGGPGSSPVALFVRLLAVIGLWTVLQARRNRSGKKTTVFTVVGRMLLLGVGFLFTFDWHVVWPSMLFWASVAGLWQTGAYYLRKNRREPRVARLIDQLRYRIPVLGPLTRLSILYRWSSTLAGVQAAGVPMAPGLELAATTAGSDWHRAILTDLQNSVRAGKPLSEAVAVYPDLFPASVRSMIATGEQTGDIATMLDSAAEAIDNEIDAITAGLAAKIEVMLLVAMGVVVGGLLVVLYLPILRLATTASDSLYKQNQGPPPAP